MSFNISTRLNNLQQQVNNIANTGLTNPMEQILNANNYAMQNLSILNSNANVLQLQSSNIGGVTTNTKLTVGGDCYVQSLHYNALVPPVGTGGNTYTLLGNSTEATAGNFTITNGSPNSGFISNLNEAQPYTTADFVFNTASASNSAVIGFTSLNNKYPQNTLTNYIDYGLFWYPYATELSIITNGVVGTTVTITNTLSLSISLKTLSGVLKVYINGVENVTLEQPIPSGSYYLTCMAYVGVGLVLSVNNVIFKGNTFEGLSEVLTVSNNGGGLSMTNINTINCGGLVSSGNVYSDGYLEIGNLVSNTSQLHFLYGDGTSYGNNFQVAAGIGDFMEIQQYKSNALYNNPLRINDKTNIIFETTDLLLTQDGTNNYYILDSTINPPMYKQIYNNVSGTVSNIGVNIHPLLSLPLYTKSNTAAYGVNYGEILFSRLTITFSSMVAFPTGLTATLYLGTGPGDVYNGAIGNNIIIPVTGGNPLAFNSTVPIILYYNNTTQFNTIYLLVKFSLTTLSNYVVAFSNTNLVASGYITNNQNGTITFY